MSRLRMRRGAQLPIEGSMENMARIGDIVQDLCHLRKAEDTMGTGPGKLVVMIIMEGMGRSTTSIPM